MPSVFANIADSIESDWEALARPEQFHLRVIGASGSILAGRGAGKTRTGAEWVRSLSEAASVARIALIGPTAADVRDTMIEGEVVCLRLLRIRTGRHTNPANAV